MRAGVRAGCVCVRNVCPEIFILRLLQYSQKEDKYEEEIKILTDKLKEVSEGTDPDARGCVRHSCRLRRTGYASDGRRSRSGGG